VVRRLVSVSCSHHSRCCPRSSSAPAKTTAVTRSWHVRSNKRAGGTSRGRHAEELAGTTLVSGLTGLPAIHGIRRTSI
jgi:hypothetical protein